MNLDSDILDELDYSKFFKSTYTDEFSLIKNYFNINERIESINAKIELLTDMASSINEMKFTFHIIWLEYILIGILIAYAS